MQSENHQIENQPESRQSAVDQVNALIGAGEQPKDIDKKEKPGNGAEDAADQDRKSGVNDQTDKQAIDQDADRDRKGDHDGGDQDESPVTLKEIAETLDVDVSELYGVQIPLGGDEFMTLGEYKDQVKRIQKLDGEIAEFNERRTSQQNELMVTRRQTEQLIQLAAASGKVSPELITKLDEMHNETIRRETAATLRTIPEWKDPKVKAADESEMIQYAGGYGFDAVEVKNIPDHRLIKLLYDATKRAQLVKSAEQTERKGKQPPREIGKRQQQQRSAAGNLRDRINQAKQGKLSRNDTVSLAADLIKQG